MSGKLNDLVQYHKFNGTYKVSFGWFWKFLLFVVFILCLINSIMLSMVLEQTDHLINIF